MAPPTAEPRSRDEGSDATKGLLVTLVALGHCVQAQLMWPWLFAGGLYDFHVIAFLLLPFLRPAAPFSSRALADRAVRYLVPFAVFALASCALWHVVFHPAAGWLALGKALVLGDVHALMAGVGFTFLWFMPALLALTLLRSAIAATSVRMRVLLISAVLAAHVVLRLARVPLPLNPLPALYVLPLGWAFAALMPQPRSRWLWLALAVAGAVWTDHLGDHINVASLQVPDWRRMDLVVLHDVYAIAATLAVVQFGRVLARIRPLVALGRYSLVVFLSHQFVLKAFDVWATRQPGYASAEFKVAVAVVAVPTALAAGWWLARQLERPGIRRWVLPNSAREWPVLGWVHPRQAGSL